MTKIAVLGATGPTGIHLARALLDRGHAVRVVSRSERNLQRAFADPAYEKVAADITQTDEAVRAAGGCALVYDCLGLPGDQMHLHPIASRAIVRAVQKCNARCVQVSSYWAYLPLQTSPLNEMHPREGGGPWIRWRREAEDILHDAGAAILHLPDFYGPYVHTSTLQNALMEAAAGRTMNWIGGARTPREYVEVGDAMRIAARLGLHDGPIAGHWVLPGSGPLNGAQVAEIAEKHLRRPVKLRAAGLTVLRLVSLFRKDLRGLMQVAPDYVKPIAYDARKLEGLIGKSEMTGYSTGIARTLDWITSMAMPS